MAERQIHHDQMNDQENPNDNDAFVPRNENGTFMNKAEAMDTLHDEALRMKTSEDAAATGRERVGAFKEAAGRGAERCRAIWGGVKEKVGGVVSWLKKLGVSAKGVGERVLGADEYVKSAYEAAIERGQEIREDLQERAMDAKEKFSGAGHRVTEAGKNLWASAVDRAEGVYDAGREKINGVVGTIKNKMNETYARKLIANAERHDNIANNEEQKAIQLSLSIGKRRESSAFAMDKAREIAPWLFPKNEEVQPQGSPEASSQTAQA